MNKRIDITYIAYFNLAYCFPHFAAISSSVNFRVLRLSIATRSSCVSFVCSPMGTMQRATWS